MAYSDEAGRRGIQEAARAEREHNQQTGRGETNQNKLENQYRERMRIADRKKDERDRKKG